MLGFDSGIMVVRSLLNMLPGGSGGLSQMQSMLGPMMMMGAVGGGEGEGGMDLGSLMPMMLMSQMGGMPGSAPVEGGFNMGQMMPMMMMMGMMKKGGKGGFFA
jgi:hypothetical protein